MIEKPVEQNDAGVPVIEYKANHYYVVYEKIIE